MAAILCLRRDTIQVVYLTLLLGMLVLAHSWTLVLPIVAFPLLMVAPLLAAAEFP